MMTKTTPLLPLALSLALAGTVLAQSGPRSSGPRMGGPRDSGTRMGGPGDGGMWDPTRRFEAAAPEIGELMPDITVYDPSGQELRLRELLRGHTSVLVLGCLT